MAELKIGIVIGSTRQGRFADKAATWMHDLARERKDIDVELIDLRDYPMPFFEDAMSPANGPDQPNEHVRAWQSKINSLDGFILTAAEYNRGPSAVLKNALDYAYNEWNKKPVAFLGYGGVGGARAVEQLRLHAVELQMAPIRAGVHILWPDYSVVQSGEKSLADLEHLNQSANEMLDQLVWWTRALKEAREELPKAA